MRLRALLPSIAAIALAGIATASHAAGINYLSSASGYMLHMNGQGGAVTAPWQGQAPIQGFSGAGQIQMNGRCLSGRAAHAQLVWEGCKAGDASQRWQLQGARLKNDGGWCADVKGNAGGANVPVLAWDCSGAGNQQWRAHYVEKAQTYAARIANPQVRAEFLKNATSAAPGTVISTTTGKIVAQGGGNIVAQGGGNIVAQGGGNIVAQGGGN